MSSSGHSTSSHLRARFLPPLKHLHLCVGGGADDQPPAEQPGNDGADAGKQPPKKPDPAPKPPPIRRRFLTPAEYAIVAQSLGGVKDHDSPGPVHPTSSVWPPRGLPDGLYRDVIYQRTKFWYYYHAVAIVRSVGVVAQLFIGATLTALGSLAATHGTAITIMAAANTIQAGILALLQNSGLPDRFRSDKQEFELVEDHIKEILDTGLVPADQTIDQVLSDCFDRFQLAKKTTQENLPTNYTSSSALGGALPAVPLTQPKPPAPPAPAPPPGPPPAPGTTTSPPPSTGNQPLLLPPSRLDPKSPSAGGA